MSKASWVFGLLWMILALGSAPAGARRSSARASSVLPTPVGPRKRNEPIGRFGSLSPLRDRRTARATASMASAAPRRSE